MIEDKVSLCEKVLTKLFTSDQSISLELLVGRFHNVSLCTLYHFVTKLKIFLEDLFIGNFILFSLADPGFPRGGY